MFCSGSLMSQALQCRQFCALICRCRRPSSPTGHSYTPAQVAEGVHQGVEQCVHRDLWHHDRLPNTLRCAALLCSPAGQYRCSGPSYQGRLTTSGSFELTSFRWQGWSCSWLVWLLQQRHFVHCISDKGSASCRGSGAGIHPQAVEAGCALEGTLTHRYRDVLMSKVILPSGLGYSRGVQSAASLSLSWSAYL